MKGNDFLKWHNRGTFAYMLGIWTMICSYGYLKYTGRLDETNTEKKEAPPVPKDPNEYVYQSGRFKATVIYKEGYGPNKTAISKFLDYINEKTGDADGRRQGTPDDTSSESR